MKKQPGAVLPTVLGELASPTKTEWTPLQVQGLASLSVVPDRNAVHRHLGDVLPVIIKVASTSDDPEMQEVAVESAARVVDAVEQTGLVMLLNELVGPMQERRGESRAGQTGGKDGRWLRRGDAESARRRVVGAQLLKHFFENTGLDVVPALPLALPALLPSALADQDEDALSAAMGALNAIVKKCKKEELPPYLNEGLEPLYPIYQHALVHGSPDAREVAAKGLGELVDHTTEKALAPYAVKITGALRSLLARGGDTLKPFLPQLQTTYVKCLSDPPNSEDRPEVREKAAESLGMLVRRAPRTEPLINELCTGVSNQVDPAARLAMGHALGEVLLNLPQATSETAQGKILAALTAQNFDLDSPRECEVIGWALGMLLRRHLPTEKAVEVFNEQVKPLLSSGSKRCIGAFALAGICWCQQPFLAEPAADELLSLADEAAMGLLPQLLKESQTEVQSAGLALAASMAKLHTRTGRSWEPLEALANRVALLVGPGDAALQSRSACLAARHFLSAAATEAKASAAKVAAAASLEKMIPLVDAKAAQALKDFGLKRICSLSFYTGVTDFDKSTSLPGEHGLLGQMDRAETKDIRWAFDYWQSKSKAEFQEYAGLYYGYLLAIIADILKAGLLRWVGSRVEQRVRLGLSDLFAEGVRTKQAKRW
eukprot:g11893.t1